MSKTSLLIALSLVFTSCCRMVCDRTQKVAITAQQRDTEIYIDGYACGTAPVLVDLDRTRHHTIVASKPGYEGQYMLLRSHHTLKAASNLVAPFIGLAVGTGIGLAVAGTGGIILPDFLIGSFYGGLAGICFVGIGTAVDLYTRSDCDLAKQAVHFNLIEAH